MIPQLMGKNRDFQNSLSCDSQLIYESQLKAVSEDTSSAIGYTLHYSISQFNKYHLQELLILTRTRSEHSYSNEINIE